MFGPGSLGGPFGQDLQVPDLEDHHRRVEAAITLLAEASELGPASELARFRAAHRRLTRDIEPTDIGALAPKVVYELVLAFRAGGGCTFGYLTQGPRQQRVPEVLRTLLGTGLEMYLDAGGDPTDAERLATAVALAFPDMSVLDAYDGTAQAMLLGWGPRPEGLDLKAYLNTRMFIDGEHRARVHRITEAVTGPVTDLARIYDALYDQAMGARFQGVGVDVDDSRRTKLYVRTDTDRADDHLRALTAALGIERFSSPLELFPTDALAREVELGVGLRPGGQPTLKATVFFPAQITPLPVVSAIESLLKEAGHDHQIFLEILRTLGGRGPGAARSFPVHGVGFEFPEGDSPKVNLYLQAAY